MRNMKVSLFGSQISPKKVNFSTLIPLGQEELQEEHKIHLTTYLSFQAQISPKK